MPIDFGLGPANQNTQTPQTPNTPASVPEVNSNVSPPRQPMDFGLKTSDSPKSDSKSNQGIGDTLSQYADNIKSVGNAAAIGVSHGIDMFASTLGKAVFKGNTTNTYPSGSLGSALGTQATPKGIQDEYNNDTKTYNTDPDSVAHPLISGAGNIAGGMLATAPAMAIAPEAIGSLGAGAMADLGLNGLAQGAARTLGYGAANALQSGVVAGVANTAGNSPDSLFNKDNAASGAKLGLALGPVQQVIGGAAGNAADYESKVNDLANMGYKGRVLATDVGQGAWNGAKEWVTNNVLSKIPFINDIKSLGIAGARQEQQQQLSQTIQQSTSNFIQTLANKNPDGTIQDFANAIKAASARKDQTIGQLSQAFKDTANQAGVGTINTLDTNGNNQLQSFLQEHRQVLSKDMINFMKSKVGTGDWSLQNLVGGNDANGNYQAGLKKFLFEEGDRLGGDSTKTANYNASNDAKIMYNNINQSIGNALKTSPDATAAWNSYNTTTHNLMNMFSKETSPDLAKAVDDYATSMKGTQLLFNRMVGNKLPGPIQDRYSNLLGQDGKDLIQNQQNINTLQGALKSSQKSDGTIDLTGLMNNIKQQGTNIPKDFSDQMGGLFQLAAKNQKGIQASTSTTPEVAAMTGAIGTAGYLNPGAVGAVGIGATALSGLISHAALGRTLMSINKLTGSNPGTSQYLMNQASKYLTSLGINIAHDDKGNTTLTRP